MNGRSNIAFRNVCEYNQDSNLKKYLFVGSHHYSFMPPNGDKIVIDSIG